MQRVSDGLAVPKNQIDLFTGKTTDVFGKFTCNLKYTPKSIHHITVPVAAAPSGALRWYHKDAIAGNILTLIAIQQLYEKTDNPTGASNSGNAGADTHTHAISHSVTPVSSDIADMEVQGSIIVIYEVA